jgi:hypothetical protein
MYKFKVEDTFIFINKDEQFKNIYGKIFYIIDINDITVRLIEETQNSQAFTVNCSTKIFDDLFSKIKNQQQLEFNFNE